MSFTRVHHVGLVTGDLDQARHVFCDGFGLAVDEHRTPLPGRTKGGDTVLEFPVGEMYYEVSKPSNETSPAGRFMAESGGRGGMHYVAIASANIAEDVRRLTSHGVKLEGQWDGKGPVFLDKTTTLGLQLQITPEEHYYVHPHFRGNGNMTGMAHIGIAARSAAEIRHLWGEVFGLVEDKGAERGLEPPARTGERRAADDPVHLVEFPLGGTVIETSIPTTEDSGTARLVQTRATMGATWHHTCPYAPDGHRFLEDAVAAGIQQIGSVPPREQTRRITGWLHPRSCLGMLVEVWNRPPGPGHYQG
ncbi:MAG: VOC family protein [Chloroflexi bacterium]|nr:VOC family protein [Chloroflexota bacterium]